MSNRNYTQYSKQPEVVEEISVEEHAVEVKMEQVEAPIVETPVVEAPIAEAPKPTTVNGVVANCTKLNVRAKASVDAAVVCVINAGDEVTINTKKSKEEWFKVNTANGVEGYCMRKFINANL